MSTKLSQVVDSLSRVDRETLLVIDEFITSNGHAPTMPEIAERRGRTVTCAVHTSNRLRTRGLLTWPERSHRQMKITDAGRKAIKAVREKVGSKPTPPNFDG